MTEETPPVLEPPYRTVQTPLSDPGSTAYPKQTAHSEVYTVMDARKRINFLEEQKRALIKAIEQLLERHEEIPDCDPAYYFRLIELIRSNSPLPNNFGMSQ